MRKYPAMAILTLFLPLIAWSQGFRGCDEAILSNRIANEVQYVNSSEILLIARGNYSYYLSFFSDTRGVLAKIVSKGGMVFEHGDELIFVDDKQVRKKYSFIEEPQGHEKNSTISSNVLLMDYPSLDWLVNSEIVNVYLRNNLKSQMRKLPLLGERENALSDLAFCMSKTLDPEKIDSDMTISQNTLPSVTSKSGSRKVIMRSNVKVEGKSKEEIAMQEKELERRKDGVARAEERLQNRIRALDEAEIDFRLRKSVFEKSQQDSLKKISHIFGRKKQQEIEEFNEFKEGLDNKYHEIIAAHKKRLAEADQDFQVRKEKIDKAREAAEYSLEKAIQESIEVIKRRKETLRKELQDLQDQHKKAMGVLLENNRKEVVNAKESLNIQLETLETVLKQKESRLIELNSKIGKLQNQLKNLEAKNN